MPGSSMLYCSCCVEKFGLQLSVEAWNHHLNSLKGPPADLMVQTNKRMPVDQLMSKERAAEH